MVGYVYYDTLSFSYIFCFFCIGDIKMRVPVNKPSRESIVSVKQLQADGWYKVVKNPKPFVGYPVIVALMAVLQVLTVVYGSRGFIFFGFDITAGWLILMPVMFYLFQIVAECYGWQYARQIMWINFIVNASMLLILFSFKYLPFNGATHSDTQSAYLVLVSPLWADAIIMLFSMLIADYITSALMTWSKFYWKGKFLIVRIAVLHCVAEVVIGFGWIAVGPIYGYTIEEAFKGALDSFYARTIVMIVLVPVASFVIKWIQNSLEGVTVFDLNIRFSPFKFKINPEESVQFSTDDWHKIADKKIDPKTLANHYDRDSLEKQLQKVNKS